MNQETKQSFLNLWHKYFADAELPMAFYYTNEETEEELVSAETANRCLIANLIRVRQGMPLRFNADSIGCGGGQRYCGFTYTLRENFEYFLSCGIPGKVEGERYKKSPELVKEVMSRWPKFQAPGKFIVFKRWDQLQESDRPEVVIFFAKPDVLAGLFTLASFDEVEADGVIAPFGAGCATIVQYPYLEKDSGRPRCVIGMFDISARPYVPAGTISFAAPMNKFIRMVENMEESFLITSSWGVIHRRMEKD
ncbi:MAG: DUF169 domain-containing protein [Deltaproteobacteria bacterium]|nr:DUF169 domain-containing protein [Deltaproteobacteria bacterium]